MHKKRKYFCEIHGSSIFKYSCGQCRLERVAEYLKKVNGNKIDVTNIRYLESNYKHKPIEVSCVDHGPFTMIMGKGRGKVKLKSRKTFCPSCSTSSGENILGTCLKNNNIRYGTQVVFKECINPKTKVKLRFDCMLLDYNLLIEFDGKQHFKPIKHFGGASSLINSQKRDAIKDEFCKKFGIHLLRIKYTEVKNISNIIYKLKRALDEKTCPASLLKLVSPHPISFRRDNGSGLAVNEQRIN